MNRTIVAVALSVVVAGVGVADLWLYRNNPSGVDGAGPGGPVASPDAAVILPLPERPTKAESVGDLIDGLLDDAGTDATQNHASRRGRVVPDGAGTRRWN